MISKYKLAIVGVSGAISVGLGALAAHALKGQVTKGMMSLDELNGFDTASKYQLFHTLAMLGTLLLNEKIQNKLLQRAFNFFVAGIICFSGSLYFLCTRHILGAEWLKFLGPITPIGGILFVAAWLCLAMAAYKKT